MRNLGTSIIVPAMDSFRGKILYLFVKKWEQMAQVGREVKKCDDDNPTVVEFS